MKRLVTLIVISLFLISFVSAVGITASAVNNDTGNKIQASISAQNQDTETDSEIQDKIRARIGNKLTAEQIKKIFTLRNRIRTSIAAGECPEKCTCTGSITKCQLNNGTREMTITAGESGNTIIQVKGIDGTTKVALYKSEDGKLYAVTKNNETRRIRLLPDQVIERIKKRLKNKLENENITLDEDGVYKYEARKRARLFFIIPVKERVNAELDPETGEIVRVRNSWWGFLAKDEESETVLGESCGTVTPGQNDACCQNKGYDFWNSETEQCEFNTEE
jgi:hypothetical protein